MNPMLVEHDESPLQRKLMGALVELLTHPQLDPESEEYIFNVAELVGQVNLAPIDGTEMVCDRCFAVNALGYKMKRSGDKYIALCVDEEGGCAAKDIPLGCNFIDNMGVTCDQLAAFQIIYGHQLLVSYSCALHVSSMLKTDNQEVLGLR